MNRIFTLIIICLCFLSVKAQIPQPLIIHTCETGKDVVTIVDTVLLKGLKEKGLVKNIRYKGDPRQFGRFEYGDSIGLRRGIVMCCGLAEKAKGGNFNSLRGTSIGFR